NVRRNDVAVRLRWERRGIPRRARLRHCRNLCRGSDGRAHTRVPWKKDRKARDRSRLTRAADPSTGHSGAYRLVHGRALWFVLDGQCSNAWILRSSLRIHQLCGQQWLGLRGPERQYALVQFGDRPRHPNRPLSSDHLYDGGRWLSGSQAHSGDHGRYLAHRYLAFWWVLAGHGLRGWGPDVCSRAGIGTGRRTFRHEASIAVLMMVQGPPPLQK